MKNSLLRRWTAAGVAGVLAIGLCACGGAGARTDAESTSSMPTTSVAVPKSATPSPSPTRTGPLTTGPGVLPGEKPPVESPLAYEHTAAGAFAFSAYFMHAISWSIATNDAWLVEQLGAPTCKACRNYIQAAARLKAKGETQRGGRPTVVSARMLSGKFPVADAEYAFEYIVDESAAQIAPSGPTTSAHHNVRAIVYVAWRSVRWSVLEQTS